MVFSYPKNDIHDPECCLGESGLRIDVRPAFEDAQGVSLAALESGTEGDSGCDVQVQDSLVLKGDGDGM